MQKSSVPALERALDILELVAHSGPKSFGEICAQLSLPTASAARLLNNLVAREYLKKDKLNLYCVGSAVSQLVSPNLSERLQKAGAPLLKQLMLETGNTYILFFWNGTETVCLDKQVHEDALGMQKIGERRSDIECYPWSALIYSALDAAQRRTMIGHGTQAKQLKKRFDDELASLRKHGYIASSFGDSRLTAPIYDEDAELIGILALGGTHITAPKSKFPQLGSALAKAAQNISEYFGFEGV